MDAMTADDILDTAREIAQEYMSEDLTLTLRQLYYQFVARGLLPSSQKTYKRIGSVLTKARYAGLFPVDWIDDRGRSSRLGGATQDDVNPKAGLYHAAQFITGAPSVYLGRDRWLNQQVYPSVWVEKEALSGIVETVAKDLGVSWMACKGYPSVSALREWLAQAWLATCGQRYIGAHDYQRQFGGCRRAVILYLGDHDPDGLEIPLSAERNLRKLMLVTGWYVRVEVKRIALTLEQIREYNPPPFPAKVSARFARYVRETGLREAWELDALEPRVLRDLIQREANELFEPAIHKLNSQEVYTARADMKEGLLAPGFIEEAFGGYPQPGDDALPAADLLEKQTREKGVFFGDDGQPETVAGKPLSNYYDDEDDDSHLPDDDDFDDDDDGEES